METPEKRQKEKEQILKNLRSRWASLRFLKGGADILLMFEHQQNDKKFWADVFNHFCYQKSYLPQVVAPETEAETKNGIHEVLKYLAVYEEHKEKLAHIRIAFCIDSDYRFLAEDQNTQGKSYVWQTFTHSFECHNCYPRSLNNLLKNRFQLSKELFDFEVFIANYSATIYPILLYWLYFNKNGHSNPKWTNDLSWERLKNKIGISPNPSIEQHSQAEIANLRGKVQSFISELRAVYSDIDLIHFQSDIESKFDIRKENACFYLLQGHILYESIENIVKSILDKHRPIEKELKEKYKGTEIKDKLKEQQETNERRTLLITNFKNAYHEALMEKLGQQMTHFFLTH
jgi:hypothetical protein